jgi:hypothetical protein
MGLADPAMVAQAPSPLSKFWPAILAVGGALAIVAAVFAFRVAHKTPPAAAAAASAEAVVAAAAPAEATPPSTPDEAESHMPVIDPGQRLVPAAPSADPAGASAAAGDPPPAPVVAAAHFAPRRASATPAPKSDTPKPPVNTCDLKCEMQRALRKKH